MQSSITVHTPNSTPKTSILPSSPLQPFLEKCTITLATNPQSNLTSQSLLMFVSVSVLAKCPHQNVGDEPTIARTNQDADAGLKRPKKECPPRTNLGLFHAQPGIKDQELFPKLKGKPPYNKFCIQGKACDKLRHICKFLSML
jgi:hypothetical protein